MPKIIVALHVQPEFRGGIKRFCQAKGHFGAYAHVAVDQLRNRFAGDPEIGRERSDRDPERVEIHFFQYFAGVNRGQALL